MNVQQLQKIVKKFWEQEKKSDRFQTVLMNRYYMGDCLNFAVALYRFLGGRGTIMSYDGLFQGTHYALYYKGLYWDADGGESRKGTEDDIFSTQFGKWRKVDAFANLPIFNNGRVQTIERKLRQISRSC